MAVGVLEHLGSLFRGVVGAEDGVHLRVWGELKPWIGNLVPSATRKWIPRITGGDMCEVPIMRRGQVVGECDHFGLAVCDICHRPVCLEHSRIDQNADAICFLCMTDAMQAVPVFQRERARQQQQQGAPKARTQRERQDERDKQRQQERQQEQPPPGKRPPNALEVLDALTRLELKPGASWDDVRAAHRRLSAKLHPDRGKTVKEKAKLEAKFVEVQKALDLLKRVYPGAA